MRRPDSRRSSKSSLAFDLEALFPQWWRERYELANEGTLFCASNHDLPRQGTIGGKGNLEKLVDDGLYNTALQGLRKHANNKRVITRVPIAYRETRAISTLAPGK